MYRLLCRLLPESLAGLVMACWYTLLLILTWLYWDIASGAFRYLSL